MKNNENSSSNSSQLPMNTLKEVPTPGANAQQIVAQVKKDGQVIGYKLADGRTLSKEEGVALAQQGGIQGVGVGETYGSEYLKSLPDTSAENNLGSLPSVTE